MPFLSEKPIPEQNLYDQVTLILFAPSPDFDGFIGPIELIPDFIENTWTTILGPDETWQTLEEVINEFNCSPEFIEWRLIKPSKKFLQKLKSNQKK